MADFMSSLPIVGGFFDNTEDRVLAELAKNRQLLEGIEAPELTWQDYAPELYQNETANYELINEDPLLRSRQMSVLNNMANLAETGLSDVDAAGFAQARAEGNQMARAGTEAALQNAAARGVGGSGLEFALREMANQAGSERAQQAGLQTAATAAQQRALYNQAYGNALSGMRGDDYRANSANTNIINQFNQANTQNRNATNMANTDLRNQTQLTNQQGRNNIAQQNFDNKMARATGQMNANKDYAQGIAAGGAANAANRNMLTDIGMRAGMAYATGGLSEAGAAAKTQTSNIDPRKYSGYA